MVVVLVCRVVVIDAGVGGLRVEVDVACVGLREVVDIGRVVVVTARRVVACVVGLGVVRVRVRVRECVVDDAARGVDVVVVDTTRWVVDGRILAVVFVVLLLGRWVAAVARLRHIT